MVKVITPEDKERIDAALRARKKLPKFRLTFMYEPSVPWIETVQPGIFTVVMNLEELLGEDWENSPLLEQAKFDLGTVEVDAATLAKYIELYLEEERSSLTWFIYDCLGFGDHFEYTDLDVEDET